MRKRFNLLNSFSGSKLRFCKDACVQSLDEVQVLKSTGEVRKRHRNRRQERKRKSGDHENKENYEARVSRLRHKLLRSLVSSPERHIKTKALKKRNKPKTEHEHHQQRIALDSEDLAQNNHNRVTRAAGLLFLLELSFFPPTIVPSNNCAPTNMLSLKQS